MTRPTPAAMAAHVEALAAQHGVDLLVKAGASGRAWKRSRRVRISPVKTAVTYAVALHELGHLLGRKPSTRLAKEVAAWEWAKANALAWTAPMEGKLVRCLLSYRRWADRRNGVRSDCPKLDAMLGNV